MLKVREVGDVGDVVIDDHNVFSLSLTESQGPGKMSHPNMSFWVVIEKTKLNDDFIVFSKIFEI